MKYITIEDLRWFGAIALALLILAPVLLIDHLKTIRRVNRQADGQRPSKSFVTDKGQIVRRNKGSFSFK